MASRRGSLSQDISASLTNFSGMATRLNSAKRPASGLLTPSGVRIATLKRYSPWMER